LKTQYSLEDKRRQEIVSLSRGSIGRAVALATQPEERRKRRKEILDLLAKKNFGDHRSLLKIVHSLTEGVELRKKEMEEEVKDQLHEASQISAQYQQSVEKEVEGIAAIALLQESYSLLEQILSWHRDLHVVLLGGDSSLLINSDCLSELEQVVQQGNVQPLDQVHKIVQEAYDHLEKAMPISLCLENVLLKLNYV
jgi:DNA polymerase III subunit delta'